MAKRFILHHGRPAETVDVSPATQQQIIKAITGGRIINIVPATIQQIRRALLGGHPEERLPNSSSPPHQRRSEKPKGLWQTRPGKRR